MIYNIFFVHRTRGLNLLTHSFSGSKLDEDLVSGFISAIISFIDALHPPKKDSKQEKLIRTIDRGDFKILIEAGEYVFGILFVNIEKVEVRKNLRDIIREFEANFDFNKWDSPIFIIFFPLIVICSRPGPDSIRSSLISSRAPPNVIVPLRPD